MEFSTMLQRQMEVAGALRSPPKTADELQQVRLTMKALSTFITQISRTATKLQIPLESVFQCLMQMGLGTQDGVSFDRQHRQGNVPMHQAKVLDRNAALNALSVEPKLRDAVEASLLQQHVAHCSEMRSLLRMKVEDGNDLSMARKLVSLAEEYLDHIYRLSGGSESSKGDPSLMMKLYLADDEDSIRALLGLAQEAQDGSGSSGPLGASDILRGSTKSLPGNLCRGVQDECHHGALGDVKAPFAQRQQALANVSTWVQVVDKDTFDKVAPQLFSVLCDPLKAQLADKRSAVCRLACDIASTLCTRAPAVAFDVPRTREVLLVWLEVLLKGVHVTVAAIADATDLTVRDMVISTHGALWVLNHLSFALSKASQAELRRKLLNFIALGIWVHVPGSSSTALGALSLIAGKMCSSSEEPVRRVARVILVVLEVRHRAQLPSGIDAKVERLLAQDREALGELIAKNIPVAEFELNVLKYPAPCQAASLDTDVCSVRGALEQPTAAQPTAAGVKRTAETSFPPERPFLGRASPPSLESDSALTAAESQAPPSKKSPSAAPPAKQPPSKSSPQQSLRSHPLPAQGESEMRGVRARTIVGATTSTCPSDSTTRSGAPGAAKGPTPSSAMARQNGSVSQTAPLAAALPDITNSSHSAVHTRSPPGNAPLPVIPLSLKSLSVGKVGPSLNLSAKRGSSSGSGAISDSPQLALSSSLRRRLAETSETER